MGLDGTSHGQSGSIPASSRSFNSLCILKDNLKNQESIKICALIRGYELYGQEYKIGDKFGIYVSWDGEE